VWLLDAGRANPWAGDLRIDGDMPARDDHFHLGRNLKDLPDHVGPAHRRHVQIGHYDPDLVLVLLVSFQSVPAIGCRYNLKACKLEPDLHQLPDRRFVIDHQDYSSLLSHTPKS